MCGGGGWPSSETLNLESGDRAGPARGGRRLGEGPKGGMALASPYALRWWEPPPWSFVDWMAVVLLDREIAMEEKVTSSLNVKQPKCAV